MLDDANPGAGDLLRRARQVLVHGRLLSKEERIAHRKASLTAGDSWEDLHGTKSKPEREHFRGNLAAGLSSRRQAEGGAGKGKAKVEVVEEEEVAVDEPAAAAGGGEGGAAAAAEAAATREKDLRKAIGAMEMNFNSGVANLKKVLDELRDAPQLLAGKAPGMTSTVQNLEMKLKKDVLTLKRALMDASRAPAKDEV